MNNHVAAALRSALNAFCSPLCDNCPSVGEPTCIPVPAEAVEGITTVIAALARGGRCPDIVEDLVSVIDGLLVRGESVEPYATITPEGLVALDRAVKNLDRLLDEEAAYERLSAAFLAIPAVCRKRVLVPTSIVHEEVTRAAVLVIAARRELALRIRDLGAVVEARCTTCRNSRQPISLQTCARCATDGGCGYMPLPLTPEQRRAANPGKPTVQMTHEEALRNPPEGLFARGRNWTDVQAAVALPEEVAP